MLKMDVTICSNVKNLANEISKRMKTILIVVVTLEVVCGTRLRGAVDRHIYTPRHSPASGGWQHGQGNREH